MIRKITKDDIDQVNKMVKEFNYQVVLDDLNRPFFNCIINNINGDLCGVLIYELIYDRIEIDYIIVKEKERKKGIASELLNYLFNKEVSDNISNITLEVNKNNIPAINLYTKFKFEIVSIRKKYYKDEDGYLMIRKFDNNE